MNMYTFNIITAGSRQLLYNKIYKANTVVVFCQGKFQQIRLKMHKSIILFHIKYVFNHRFHNYFIISKYSGKKTLLFS